MTPVKLTAARRRPAPPESAAAPRDVAEEFDCRGCGRHIVRFCTLDLADDLCAHCHFRPGWQDDPALRRLFAPAPPAAGEPR